MWLILSANINCGSIDLLNFLKFYEPNPRSFPETAVGLFAWYMRRNRVFCATNRIRFWAETQTLYDRPTTLYGTVRLASGQENRTEDRRIDGKEGGSGLNPTFRNENY